MKTLRHSRVLKALRNGESASSLKINLSDPRVIEICGMAGVDAVWLCNEHVPNDWLNLENQIRAAKLHDMDTIVRVERGSYSGYVKPFEADATGIMVPHVTSADEARQVVEWTRFHPLGKRAIDGGNADARFCRVGIDDYIEHSNSERLIILQIESPEAVANVDEIAQVPGYDIRLFGPGDYSHLIGKAGNIHDPEVVEARQRVGAAARRHGKFAMSAGLMGSREMLEKEGYRFFNLGADVVGLTHFCKNALADFVAASAKQPTAIV